MTLADPAEPAGTVAVMVVALTTVKAVAAFPANFTDVAPVKFVPVIVTALPPADGPESGATDVTVGNGITVTDELAVFPVPELDPTVTLLIFVPAVVAVTLTLNVQEDGPAPSEAPEREIVPAPATAEIVPPPHEPVRLLGVATVSPAGRLFVKPTAVTAELPAGLVMV
jgi:hypothetical protein